MYDIYMIPILYIFVGISITIMENREWMYGNKLLSDGSGWTQEFINGVEVFLAYATSQVHLMDGHNIRCPCSTCKNERFKEIDTCRVHLYRRGFVANYMLWNAHGESSSHHNDMDFFGIGKSLFDNLNPTRRMVFDAAGPSNYVPPPDFDPYNSVHEAGTSNAQNEYSSVPDDMTCFLSERFSEVLRAADEPLYHGSHVSQLAAVSSFMELKTKYNMSQSAYSSLLQKVSDVLPEDNNLPKSYYEQKKMTRDLGLPQVKIHMCVKGCMLFWKEYANDTECRFCKSARYKPTLSQKGKPIPNQVLRYLPFTPRLQRLYAMKETAEKMSWYASHHTEDGFMSHPSDAEAWKHFDRTFPEFASEVRNVRLCLCSDGFSPFGKFGKTYSTWPVILTPYNLPPEMCMQTRFLFLSTIVPGPHNPKKLIDICMQPLIDELLMLWNEGVPTFDVSTGEHFRMRAALMWTVSDFPAYGMLSGWSTAGIYSCPYCMNRTKSFRLQHGRKPSWFDCYRCLLPRNHTFKTDKKNFYKGRAEKDPSIPYLSGQQMWEC